MNYGSFEKLPRIFWFNGAKTLSYLGPKMWDLVLNEIKQLDSLKCIKLNIKKWIAQDCLCRLCKRFIYQMQTWTKNV